MYGQEFGGFFSIWPEALGGPLSTFGGSGSGTFVLIFEV